MMRLKPSILISVVVFMLLLALLPGCQPRTAIDEHTTEEGKMVPDDQMDPELEPESEVKADDAKEAEEKAEARDFVKYPGDVENEKKDAVPLDSTE